MAKNNKAQEEKRKNLLGGFNSILCVESIPMAIAYYTEPLIKASSTVLRVV